MMSDIKVSGPGDREILPQLDLTNECNILCMINANIHNTQILIASLAYYTEDTANDLKVLEALNQKYGAIRDAFNEQINTDE